MGGPLTPTARATRAKLMVVLPLVMALLVGATGFFTLSMARRAHEDYREQVAGSLTLALPTQAAEAPPLTPDDEARARGLVRGRFAQLGFQIVAIAVIAAVLGFGIALGVSRPIRRMTEQLEALASGDLRGGLSIASTSELDSLGGAVNDAIASIQRTYMQAMTGAVITLDAEGRVIGSSAAAEATLGYREEDLVGRRFSDVFTPAAGSRSSLTAVESAIARREPVSLDDVEIVSADGRPLRIGISASYLQSPSARATGDLSPSARAAAGGSRAAHAPGGTREIVGVTIAFKDLNQMRGLRARLQQADQLVALGTVTAGVAHEIRNPLASLRGLAELLGRDIPADDRRRRYVDTMLESIDRLNRLIEELLLFSAPKGIETTDIDLGAALLETASLARHGLGDRAVAIVVTPDPPPPVVVRGSRERLLQVLTNLVLNATQAAPDGGVVTIRLSTRDAVAVADVHNTGSYIPPQVRKQLFVPFFTTKPTGTGLGLAIARQIVIGMEGRLDVESDPETGTTFTIELPLAVREALAV